MCDNLIKYCTTVNLIKEYSRLDNFENILQDILSKLQLSSEVK